jgi:hypothetical protein
VAKQQQSLGDLYLQRISNPQKILIFKGSLFAEGARLYILIFTRLQRCRHVLGIVLGVRLHLAALLCLRRFGLQRLAQSASGTATRHTVL